jgi:hypothetical protein
LSSVSASEDEAEAAGGRKRRRESRSKPAPAATTPPAKKAKLSEVKAIDKSALLAKLKSNFNLSIREVSSEDEEVENLGSEFSTPFACGLCPETFATVDKLEQHFGRLS